LRPARRKDGGRRECAIVDTSRQGNHTLPRHVAAPQGQGQHRVG
jgi:hypothetical protein